MKKTSETKAVSKAGIKLFNQLIIENPETIKGGSDIIIIEDITEF